MKNIFLFLSLVAAGSLSAQNGQNSNAVYPIAEYDRAALIVMHEPNEELFVGTMHPAAALFMDYFNADAAAKEHQAYQKILRDKGAEVITVRELLLKDCVDEDGNRKEGSSLDELQALAEKYLIYTCEEGVDPAEQEQYRQELLNKLYPNDLVDVILQQPEIILRQTAINTGLEASYRLRPVMNMFFMRDQAITTSKGVIIGKMNSSQRQLESDIAELCYKKLGEKPIYRITGDNAFLEGGDYLPFGTLSFIGCGLRTTQEAIDQLLEKDLIGKDTLVVVKDAWKSQEQMHLDTYFNIIDRDLVTLCANRANAEEGDVDFLTYDMYAKDSNGQYQQTETGSFLDFLAKRGIEIIPIEKEDELNYANNFLAVGKREIVMVAGQSLELQKALREHGVDVTWAYLDNLTRGYGAAHCMTQVVRRVHDDSGATANEAVHKLSNLQVIGGVGQLQISSDEPQQVYLYDLNGRLVENQFVSSRATISLEAGCYLVKAANNSSALKVIVR